jgi:hypothetical protein
VQVDEQRIDVAVTRRAAAAEARGAAVLFAPERTILVKLGDVRVPSDFGGMTYLALDNGHASRQALAVQLQKITSSADLTRTDHFSSAHGGDFEACLPTAVSTQSPFTASQPA